MIDTFVVTFLLIGGLLFINKTVDKIIEEMKKEKRLEEERKREKEKSEPVSLKQAERWEKALEQLGEVCELDALQEMAEERTFPKGTIPYGAVFAKDEYHYVLSKVYQGTPSKGAGFKGGFTMEALPAAVHVRKLACYALELERMLSLFDEKSKRTELSSKALLKMGEVQDELDDANSEIRKYAYVGREVNEQNRCIYKRLTFCRLFNVDENEILRMVDKTIRNGRTEINASATHDTIPTSPAVADLKQFLNTHRLPNSVYQELRNTMQDIEKMLMDEEKDKREKEILLQAQVINETAKKFHQIDKDVV